MGKNHSSSVNEWPISSEYIARNLNLHLKEKININSTRQLKTDQIEQLRNLINQLEEPTIYLPVVEAQLRYDLIKDAPNLFAEFASNIGAIAHPTDKEIVAWLQDYGPLFEKPVNLGRTLSSMENAHSYQPQNITEITFEMETAWYWAFDEYIILKDTMVKLSRITHDALELLMSLRTEDENRLEKIMSRALSNEPFRQRLLSFIHDRESVDWSELGDIITQKWLLPLVQHYLAGAIPAFDCHSMDIKHGRSTTSREKITVQRPVKFTRTWTVPDQWRAMWVHFYEQITANTEFRSCAYCKKLFPVTDNRQAYCHPRPGAKRSRCQNTVAVAEARKP